MFTHVCVASSLTLFPCMSRAILVSASSSAAESDTLHVRRRGAPGFELNRRNL